MGTRLHGEARRVGLVQRRAVDSQDLNPFYAHLVGGLEEILDAHDAAVFVVFADAAAEVDVYRRWGEQGDVDVVVLTDLVAADPRLAACRSVGLDAVVLGPEVPEGASGIAVAEGPAVRAAADHVLDDGHLVVGHVTGPSGLLHTDARAIALSEVVGAEGRVTVDVEGDYSLASGARATIELLDRDVAPTAIIYDNDLMAIGGMGAIAERGLRIPEDISILAWDDSVHCRLAEPPISAVSRDVRGLGILLGELIAAGSPAVQVVEAPHAQVVRRGTTGPAPR